jgi:hypothetical protein
MQLPRRGLVERVSAVSCLAQDRAHADGATRRWDDELVDLLWAIMVVARLVVLLWRSMVDVMPADARISGVDVGLDVNGHAHLYVEADASAWRVESRGCLVTDGASVDGRLRRFIHRADCAVTRVHCSRRAFRLSSSLLPLSQPLSSSLPTDSLTPFSSFPHRHTPSPSSTSRRTRSTRRRSSASSRRWGSMCRMGEFFVGYLFCFAFFLSVLRLLCFFGRVFIFIFILFGGGLSRVRRFLETRTSGTRRSARRVRSC